MSDDPVIQTRREQIAELDRSLLETLNRRIQLVQQLRAYKASRGMAFYDPAQEEKILADLCRANQGPLSEAGLIELFSLILARTRQEVAGPGEAAAD